MFRVVLQLWLAGSLTRSVRLPTVLAGIGAGAFGATLIAVGLQWASVRVMAEVTGRYRFNLVELAGHTTSPFIEELVKLLPLFLVASWGGCRWRWGMTDYAVVGAAVGSGFGLFEALARNGAPRMTSIGITAVGSFPRGYPSLCCQPLAVVGGVVAGTGDSRRPWYTGF